MANHRVQLTESCGDAPALLFVASLADFFEIDPRGELPEEKSCRDYELTSFTGARMGWIEFEERDEDGSAL